MGGQRGLVVAGVTALIFLWPAALSDAAVPSGRTILVSTAPGGGFPQFGSRRGTVRADGREVFWWGELPSSNFVFGIIAFDPATGSQTYVSLDSSGVPLDADTGYGISPDGRFVAFVGRVASPPGIVTHPVLLRDRLAGTTVPISLTPDGAAAQSVRGPSVSADGRYVVFESNDDRLDPAAGPLFGYTNTFLRDVLAGTTTRVSTVPPEPGVTIQGRNPKISADGRWIAFDNGTALLYDRLAASTKVIARTRFGEHAAGQNAAISDDGRFIAYESFSADIVEGDTNGNSDIFIYDRIGDTTIRASVGTGGVQPNGGSFTPAISGDGRFVAFQTTATNLQTDVPDTNGRSDVFVRDLQLDQTTLVSITSAGTTPNRESFEISVSLDGSKVTFTSRGTDVLPGDTNNAQDVFMRDRSGNTAPIVAAGGDTSTSPGVAFTREGSFVDNDPGQTWSATVNYGDGPPSALALRPDKTFTLAHTYASLGVFTVEVVVSDSAGGTGRALVQVTVGNSRPRVTVGGPSTIGEGESFEGTASFTDPDVGQRWTAVIDYGDGTTAELMFTTNSSMRLSHPYEAGAFTITVRVSDGVGEPGVASLALIVSNVAPAVTVQQQITAYVDTAFRLAGTFTDPGQGETFVGNIDFGDGTAAEPLSIVGRTFTVAHRFAAIGGYRGTLALQDSHGGRTEVPIITAVLRRPLIFVPGIIGSKLYATTDTRNLPIPNGHGGTSPQSTVPGEELWPALFLWAPPADQDRFDRLKLDRDGNPYIPGIEARGLFDFPAVEGTYYRVASFFAEAGYTSANFRVFAYDWRLSAAEDDHIARLDQFVTELLATTHADSVDIVAHSMGTLVTREYLVRGQQRGHVAHAVLLGSPQLGTPDALAAAAYGECLPSDFAWCLISQAEVQDVMHTLRGAIELVPSAEYWTEFRGQDDQHPLAYVDARPRHFPSTHDGMTALLRDLSVPDAVLASSERVHESDATWFASVSAEVTFVTGVGSCTPGQLVDFRAPGPDGVTLIDKHELRMIDGDSRVVRGATGPAAVGRTVYLDDALHAVQLIQDPGLRVALDVVHDRALRAERSAGGTCATVKALSPAEVLVTDVQGHRAGSDGTVIFSEIDTASLHRIGTDKFVNLNAAGAYAVQVIGTGDGSTVVEVSWTSSSRLVSSAIFAPVPTTARSRGSFAIDTATTSVTDLLWDADGDGVAELRVRARVVTGSAARDMTPPTITVDPDLTSRTIAGGTRLAWTAVDPESGIVSTFAVIDPGTPDARRIDAPSLITLGPGSHTIRFLAENGAGFASDTSVTVNALGLTWVEPVASSSLEVAAGRTLPVKFRVSDAAGGSLNEPIASVEIRSASGALVVGPLAPASTPSRGVAIEGGDTYHVNVSTDSLAPGSYDLVIRFNSQTITGEVHRALVLR